MKPGRLGDRVFYCPAPIACSDAAPMGWILLFGPFIGAMSIALVQLLVYRGLCAVRIISEDKIPDGPIIILRSFVILIILFTIVYFTGFANGLIEPLDPHNPPEGFQP